MQFIVKPAWYVFIGALFIDLAMRITTVLLPRLGLEIDALDRFHRWATIVGLMLLLAAALVLVLALPTLVAKRSAAPRLGAVMALGGLVFIGLTAADVLLESHGIERAIPYLVAAAWLAEGAALLMQARAEARLACAWPLTVAAALPWLWRISMGVSFAAEDGLRESLRETIEAAIPAALFVVGFTSPVVLRSPRHGLALAGGTAAAIAAWTCAEETRTFVAELSALWLSAPNAYVLPIAVGLAVYGGLRAMLAQRRPLLASAVLLLVATGLRPQLGAAAVTSYLALVLMHLSLGRPKARVADALASSA